MMEASKPIVKMVFDRWSALLKNCDTLLDALTDEQLRKEVAPGKNRGIYLLGHLVAVHDEMIWLLDLGEKEHAGLYEIFVTHPDKSIDKTPTPQEIMTIWKKQLEFLEAKMQSISADEWFEKHHAVSAEDFMKEPNRNKLNILITRTTHLAYHFGQLSLLK